MLPATPEHSCEVRGCRCFGTTEVTFDRAAGVCTSCSHRITRHAAYRDVPITAKLLLTGRTIVDAVCLQCGGQITVASRYTAGATGQQTYAYGAVLSHLRSHGIETPLSPIMLTEPLKPVAYFVFQVTPADRQQRDTA